MWKPLTPFWCHSRRGSRVAFCTLWRCRHNFRTMKLLVDKHEKNLRLCLHSLPQQAQSEDSSRLALMYFCLHGLDLLGRLTLAEAEGVAHANYIYGHLLDRSDIHAFRPSQTFQLRSGARYDLPHLLATFFALCNLLVLGSDYSKRLDRHKVMRFVQRLQVKDGPDKGSFQPVLDKKDVPFGDTDLRYCYIAVSIRHLLKYHELPEAERTYDIDTTSLVAFIHSRFNYNGGLSSLVHTEPHLGLTFCGLATLNLLGKDVPDVEQTKYWLVHRQVDYPEGLYSIGEDGFDGYEYYDPVDIGGFNGRENKFSDTCYAWWITGLLHLIGGESLFNAEAAADYLLNRTQHQLLGGFGKSVGAWPDPFHTYLALASLALWKDKVVFEGSEALGSVNVPFVISGRAEQFWRELTFESA